MSELEQTLPAQDAGNPVKTDVASSEMRHRIGWLINLRWLAILCALLIVLVIQFGLPATIPTLPLWWVVVGVMTYNALFLLFWKIMKQADAFTHPAMVVFTNVQILLDLVAMAMFVCFAGGVVSLFLIVALFPIAIVGSLLLGRLNCFLLALFAVVLLNVVAWSGFFGVGCFADGALADLALYRFPFYVLAICGVLTVAILATVYIASSISSSLRRREAQLAEACRKLSALDEEKSFFMRKVSHELRSPLSAVRSCLLVALDDLPDGIEGDSVDLIRRAEVRTRNILEVVSDLLKFSRLRPGVRLTYDREPVNLAHLVDSVIETHAVPAHENDITLSRDVRPVHLEGNADSIEELLNNLVGNAVKYTRTGGTVTVRAHQELEHVVVVVSDTGIGIEPSARANIFDEFFRTEGGKAHDRTGTGLGLAIVKRVVDMHGGTIQLDSEPDKGTTFTVRLPGKRPQAPLS